jgi:hypothetical protein
VTNALHFFWHPAVLVSQSKLTGSSAMHRPRWISLFCTVAFLAPVAMALAQEPGSPAPPPPPPSGSQTAAAAPSKPGKQKYSHKNDFLIRGTVFDEKALSFPGAQLSIRRVGQKKFRWDTYTNSRGEFAVRVPQGADYELVVHVKGFPDQTRTINAKNEDSQENVVFRMQPAAGDKK